MSEITVQNNSDSPFNSIRRYHPDGSEYWNARELMPLLDLNLLFPELPLWVRNKFLLQTTKTFLGSEDLGFLLLELSSVLSMQSSIGYLKDASYVHKLALSFYKGQSATAIFHNVSSQIITRMGYAESEALIHTYVELFWEELFPFAKTIEHEYCLNKQSRVDFVLDKSIPVEIKKDPIGKDALNQLLRYMKTMQSKTGYLIAPDLEIAIPSNVQFLRVTFDEIAEKMLSSHIPLVHKWDARIRLFFARG
jgi:hypothetical protein